MKPSVVMIGNFDGVHRGHRAILAQARTIADAQGLASVVLTFDPHPAEVLRGTAPPRLATLARRIELLRSLGADDVVVEPFTKELAAWSPERFAKELLAERLQARAVVVGENFRFGAKRAGDRATLVTLGAELGFEAVTADVAGDERGAFSSTRVREAIGRGDLGEAAFVLGRDHAISGIVEEGDKLGRTIGFPTANLGGVTELLPPHGVYACRVGIHVGEGENTPARGGASTSHAGVMNIGVRPTVGGTKLRIEAHLLDFAGDLYGKALSVDLVGGIRGEQKFAGLDALKAQIARDAARAREILGLPS